MDPSIWIASPNDDSRGNKIGFASQLSLLVDALEMSFEVQFLDDFVSGMYEELCISFFCNLFCYKIDWNSYCCFFVAVEKSSTDGLKPSMVIPPLTVVDRVLKELFQDGILSLTLVGDVLALSVNLQQ